MGSVIFGHVSKLLSVHDAEFILYRFLSPDLRIFFVSPSDFCRGPAPRAALHGPPRADITIFRLPFLHPRLLSVWGLRMFSSLLAALFLKFFFLL